MKVSDIITDKYGVKTNKKINPLTSSLGTTAAMVLTNNPNRISFTIVNMSTNTVYLAFGPDVSTTNGILLLPNGGSLSVSMGEDFELSCSEVYGVASGATSSIYTLEVTIQ